MVTHQLSPRGPLIIEWLQTGVLAVNLGWTTLCLGGYRPETMVVTSTLTGLLLGLHGVARMLFPAGTGRSHPAGWIFLPFLAYAAMNVLWVTPVRWLGWHDWLWWTQMLIIFWVVLNDVRSGAAQRALLIVLGSLGFTAVVLAAYQTFVQPDWLMLGRQQAEQFAGRASGPFGIPNSLAALLLVLLPPAVVLTFSPRAGAVLRILAGYLACAYIFGLALTVSRGAWLGLAVAVVVWPLLQGGENWRRRVGRTLVAGLAVLAAGVVVYLTVPTLRARFETLVEEAGERTRPIMWRGAWQLFRENPAFGSGAGSYNVAFERHRPEHYQLDSQWAHNDYLNTLSDYGIVGFGLFFGGAALVAFLALRRRASALLAPVRVAGDGLDTPRLQSALALGLLAFGLQLFVDFHLKIPALAMTLAVVAAILVRCAWPVAVAAPGRCGRWAGRVEGLIIVVAAVGLTGGMMNPHYRAEALRYPARQAIDRLSDVPTADYAPLLAPAKAALARAVSIDPANAQAWADLAYATALSAHAEPGRIRELGREAEQQAARALALGEVVPEFWVRHAVALDMQNRWLEAGESGMRALRLAPASATIWYYHAYHLSLNPVGLPQARAAVAICLRLDPNNRAAQVLRQQLATGQ